MDTRRIVTLSGPEALSADDGVGVLRDLNASGLEHVRDSWTIAPGERQPVLASDQRRYGGASTAFETHNNGAIAWTALVSAETADGALAVMEGLLSVLELARTDLLYQWRPDGAERSSFFEIRGPASYRPAYSQIAFAGAMYWTVDVTIPIGPLALGERAVHTLGAEGPQDSIRYLPLTAPVPGRAPALTDVSLLVRNGGAGFGLVAWASRPTVSTLTGTAGAALPAPFGVFEAEAASNTRFSSSVQAVTGSRSGNVVTPSAKVGLVRFDFDPSTMRPDAFRDTVDVEIWGRFYVTNAQSSLNPFGSVKSGTAINRAVVVGSASLPSVINGTGGFRVCRLGIATFNTSLAVRQSLTVSMSDTSLDHLVLVPARQRVVTPTAKPGIEFIIDNNAYAGYYKTIRSDLRATISGVEPAGSTGASGIVPTEGMGGSRIEMPPGDVDVLAWVDRLTPDDPTPLESGGTNNPLIDFVRVSNTARYWLTAS